MIVRPLPTFEELEVEKIWLRFPKDIWNEHRPGTHEANTSNPEPKAVLKRKHKPAVIKTEDDATTQASKPSPRQPRRCKVKVARFQYGGPDARMAARSNRSKSMAAESSHRSENLRRCMANVPNPRQQHNGLDLFNRPISTRTRLSTARHHSNVHAVRSQHVPTHFSTPTQSSPRIEPDTLADVTAATVYSASLLLHTQRESEVQGSGARAGEERDESRASASRASSEADRDGHAGAEYGWGEAEK
ncbi:hypothetical protein ST47_g8488 [Ascochyta rabiei]|uniref:Uncharacterized protein n=1 Tax=Didymella rabiei TaxID=5454 RepID=A0A162YYZ3_DIDRA|nr:hypothetical protein ST47_g8488 [Ascochyta rabiei]